MHLCRERPYSGLVEYAVAGCSSDSYAMRIRRKIDGLYRACAHLPLSRGASKGVPLCSAETVALVSR